MSAFINTIEVHGDDAVMDSIIEGTISEFRDNILETIGLRAFHGLSSLRTVDLPSATSIGGNAFEGCANLTEIVLPKVTKILENGQSVFRGCTSLQRAVLPSLVNSSSHSLFSDCTALTTVDFYVAESVGGANAFYNCKALTALILRGSKVASFTINSNTFTSTPIASGTGYIYVPASLVDSYKAATNWSTYAAQIRALEDYTVDGTVTGKFSAGHIIYDLTYFESSNTESYAEGSYQTTLTAYGDNATVSITMDGIDVTAEVYNAETGEVTIPKVAGDIVITASCDVQVPSIPTWYNLSEATTFNGTSDYIDTGIKLFDTAKDFTIVVNATFSALASGRCLLHCMNEAGNYPGVSIDGNSGVRICCTGSSSITTSITPASNVSVLALRYRSGVLNMIRYRNVGGQIISHSITGTPIYTRVTQNLLLGAYQTTNGTKGRFFNGTINTFKVYDIALDDEIVDTLLRLL